MRKSQETEADVKDVAQLQSKLRRFAVATKEMVDAQLMEEAANALEELRQIKQLANADSVDSFMLLPEENKRAWFALMVMESNRRKKAEEALAAALQLLGEARENLYSMTDPALIARIDAARQQQG